MFLEIYELRTARFSEKRKPSRHKYKRNNINNEWINDLKLLLISNEYYLYIQIIYSPVHKLHWLAED